MPHWEMVQCSITTLKKAVYDGGWEATSILVLRRRIKEWAWQIPLPTILHLFNTVKELLLFALKMVIGRSTVRHLTHNPLGTD